METEQPQETQTPEPKEQHPADGLSYVLGLSYAEKVEILNSYKKEREI